MSFELATELGDKIYYDNLERTRDGLLRGILRIAKQRKRLDLVVEWIKKERPDIARDLGVA